MLICVINLRRRPDRLALMAAQLDSLGLPFTRIEAVDGAAPGFSVSHADMSRGEAACTLSHLAAWQQVLASGRSHGLILEDDSLLSPELAAFLAAPGNIPPEAELVRIEAMAARAALGPARPCATEGFGLHPIRGNIAGAGAYVLSRAFTERASRDLAHCPDRIDHLLFCAGLPTYYAAVAYQLRPALTIQACLEAQAGSRPEATSDLDAERQPSGTAPPPAARRLANWPARKARHASAWIDRLLQFLRAGTRQRRAAFTGPFLPVAVDLLSGRAPFQSTDAARPL